jgi:iron complex transport system permease protein
MKSKYNIWVLFLFITIILVLIVLFVSLFSGELNIVPKDFFNKSSIEYSILTKIRLPRVILAFSIGGALSLTGALLQGIYRNPLVEPYTLGISGGAAFGVALTIVLGLHMSVGTFMLPLSGFTGALITIFLVYFLSIKNGGLNINRMLLIGIMISFVASSFMMFLMAITSVENLHSIVFWIMGSLDEPNTSLIKIMFFSSLIGLIISYFFARPLNALRLGETKARHLGIKTTVTIRILFIVASLLTGICVSVAGVIGFVGLIIPHLVRLIIGSDYRIFLIGSYLGGSLFLLISDIIARTIISPNELPIGVITGIFGGLTFIVVLSKSKLKTKMV